ncbi:MAG: hypothetical protein JOZ00_21655 [Mycobacterium sp.]|nr:hypothetical protein [Mycobacterium sp.]MBV8789276.1 hypothetical protein [Mycobacterium sp.]
MALAVGFIAVHTTVLSGINVAHPRRQNARLSEDLTPKALRPNGFHS